MALLGATSVTELKGDMVNVARLERDLGLHSVQCASKMSCKL
jgi:hypothetical protein